MAKDHFVARTYLKHWCDPRTGQLQGYKKLQEQNFPCSPGDVCHEWNWDINPLFKDNPGLLADYRNYHKGPRTRVIGANQLSSTSRCAA